MSQTMMNREELDEPNDVVQVVAEEIEIDLDSTSTSTSTSTSHDKDRQQQQQQQQQQEKEEKEKKEKQQQRQEEELEKEEQKQQQVTHDASQQNSSQSQRAKKYVTIEVSKSEHEKYHFKPQVIGPHKILFLDAQELSYYKKKLKKPMMHVWVLTSVEEKVLKYVNKRLFEEAWRMNIQLDIMYIPKFDLVCSKDGVNTILYDGEMVTEMPDCVYPRLGANIDYFGMAVVRHLEKMDTLVLNPVESLDVSKDKLYTLQQLGSYGLPIPKTMIAKFPIDIKAIEREFSFPLILKKSSGSQGKGVMLVRDAEALQDVSSMIDVNQPLIFQEFIANSSGRDIRVFVIGGKAIGGIMRTANKGFKANFHQGGSVKSVKLSPAVEWLAIETSRLVGLDVAGVDILIDQDTYKICEINSSPGFEGFEQATGMNIPRELLQFMQIRCGVWKKNRTEELRKKQPITIELMAEHKFTSAASLTTTPATPSVN